MSPDFHELIGDEGTPEELGRLRQVHDMLVAAGPPPELSPRLADVPKSTARTGWLPKRRKWAALVVAAGVAAAAFGVGFLIGNRGSNEFPSNRSAIEMHPVSHSSTARASILVGDRDSVGNWPLLVHATGLKPLPKGAWYELYLTRDGKIVAWCGTFSAEKSGRTTVRFSIPYRLKGAGWVVTTSERQRNPQVLLTT